MRAIVQVNLLTHSKLEIASITFQFHLDTVLMSHLAKDAHTSPHGYTCKKNNASKRCFGFQPYKLSVEFTYRVCHKTATSSGVNPKWAEKRRSLVAADFLLSRRQNLLGLFLSSNVFKKTPPWKLNKGMVGDIILCRLPMK